MTLLLKKNKISKMFQKRTVRRTHWTGARASSDLFAGAGHWNCSGATIVANAPLNSINIQISLMQFESSKKKKHEQSPVFSVELLVIVFQTSDPVGKKINQKAVNK